MTDLEVGRQYEAAIREAASILMCNYSSLNMAISMGFSARHHIASDKNQDRFVAKRGQVTQLKNLIGGILADQPPPDITIRVHIINILVELLLQEEIEVQDLEDCLDDWMEENFNVLSDEDSNREIGNILYRVRRELTFCAINDIDLPSGSKTVLQLKEFNERNRVNVQEMDEDNRARRGEVDHVGLSDNEGSSSGFEENSSSDDDSDSDDDKGR